MEPEYVDELTVRKVQRAIEQIARQQGMEEGQVRANMQEAILAAYSNDDPAVRAEWAHAPFGDRMPTVEEFMSWCIMRIESRELQH